MGIKEDKTSKPRDHNKESSEILSLVKRVLRKDCRGFENEKLTLFFLSLSSYHNCNFVFILRDSISTTINSIINSIFSLHPEDYNYINTETGTKCRKTLIFREWLNEKNLYLMNFEKNKEFINRFLNNHWTFTETLRNKDSPEPFIKEYNLPHMNIFCSTSLDKIPENFENGAFILEFRHTKHQSRERSQYYAYESHNYQVMSGINKKVDEFREDIKNFLSKLDTHVIIEIPYEKLLRKYFRYDLAKNVLYHTIFMELIKSITFFYQYDRDYYIINETRERVIISEFEDLELAWKIGSDIFSELTSIFNKKQADFFNFIIKTIPDKDDFIDISKISGGEVIGDYRSYLERNNQIPLTPRQYRNYLKIFVKNGYLKHKKENNHNYYWVKHTPSLKTLNLEDEKIIAEKYISKRNKDLRENESIDFFNNYQKI